MNAEMVIVWEHYPTHQFFEQAFDDFFLDMAYAWLDFRDLPTTSLAFEMQEAYTMAETTSPLERKV